MGSSPVGACKALEEGPDLPPHPASISVTRGTRLDRLLGHFNQFSQNKCSSVF